MTNQFAQPHKTTGEVTVLHILVLVFLENQWEYKIMGLMVGGAVCFLKKQIHYIY
jgi:hypothetical protein